MIGYIQLWNQGLWPWETHAEEVSRTKEGETIEGNWNCGIRRNYQIGARAYVYRVVDNRGIVASGHVVDKPFQAEHFDGTGRLLWCVPIDFDAVLDLHEILSRDRLESEVAFDWRHIQGSGKEISGEAAAKLEDLWKRHLAAMGRASQTSS
jgi:hypothetical protein